MVPINRTQTAYHAYRQIRRLDHPPTLYGESVSAPLNLTIYELASSCIALTLWSSYYWSNLISSMGLRHPTQLLLYLWLSIQRRFPALAPWDLQKSPQSPIRGLPRRFSTVFHSFVATVLQKDDSHFSNMLVVIFFCSPLYSQLSLVLCKDACAMPVSIGWGTPRPWRACRRVRVHEFFCTSCMRLERIWR
jgi:hypothetical protein